MTHPFYPFVDNDPEARGTDARSSSAPTQSTPSVSEVRYAARIAVYDDAAAAPRVVVVDPTDVRSYLEEITSQVTKLSHDQGGSIPFMVIREVVENFIHAYFIEPTISILEGGDTIRFSDQGPGIKEKERALEYGTSSATEEMKQYIRGVGSGLPYAQQYMEDKGGSLTIEDNISQGTVVTISTHPATRSKRAAKGAPLAAPSAAQAPSYAQPGWQGAPQSPYQHQQAAQGWPQPQQQAWPYQPYQAYQAYQPQPQPPAYPQATVPQQAAPLAQAATPVPWPSISSRGEAILSYLAEHDAVGPTDLARAYGESQPTWTRELKALEEDGLIKKEGQKRRLTRMGTAYLSARQS